jgi:tetratricopeptide (TPR) repeat protein
MMALNFLIEIRKRFFLITITVIFCFVNIAAQTNIHAKISSGLEALYNFNFKTSNKAFDNIISKYPDNPAGYYYKSIRHLWFYLDSKNEIDLLNFISLTDTAILKAEAILKTDSSDEFSLYILGSAYANRTFAFTRDESYFDAVIAARKFHSCFDELLNKDSLYYDAYTGKGLFNFAISQAPQTWTWAINLAGMTGDKRLGLNYLEVASKKGKLSRVDAQFYLSQIYSEFLLKYQEAKKILNDLTFRYPKNLLFKFALANLQVKTYDLVNASRNYKTVFTSKDTNFIQLKNYAGMALGDILYSKGDYDQARSYYIKFLEQSTDDHFKGITALNIGLSHLFEGDSLSSLMYFDKTDQGNEDLDDDNYARMKGELYLTKLPDADELKLILVKNMINAGNFKSATDILEKFVEQTLSDTLRAEAILSLSDAYFHLNKFKRSLEYALAVFNFNDCELWIKPFACYYAARASKELNNRIDAELFIEYANNFNNYLYENKLKDKLNFLSFVLKEK